MKNRKLEIHRDKCLKILFKKIIFWIKNYFQNIKEYQFSWKTKILEKYFFNLNKDIFKNFMKTESFSAINKFSKKSF